MIEALKQRVNADVALVRRGRYLTTTFLLAVEVPIPSRRSHRGHSSGCPSFQEGYRGEDRNFSPAFA
ncbi:MAG TPA: hypothetical protein VGM00_11875 [Bradyrhizobium sp.]|jgi:hypothetical protein